MASNVQAHWILSLCLSPSLLTLYNWSFNVEAKALTPTEFSVCWYPDNSSRRRLKVLKLVVSSSVIDETGMKDMKGIAVEVIEFSVASPRASKPCS